MPKYLAQFKRILTTSFPLIQYLIPQHILSRLCAKIANMEFIWLKNLIIDAYIKCYKISMQEAMESDPHNYKTFNDFFTRALKPGSRPIETSNDSIISPVDGKIAQIGVSGPEQFIQAKGYHFTVQHLLGDIDCAKIFADGNFATIYLAPNDYHRIHMPITGTLKQSIYIPGRLFSVSPSSVNCISNVLTRNERLVTIFDTDIGPLAIILVGAIVVASIETVWGGAIIPNKLHNIQAWSYDNPADAPIILPKGAELGRFKLGSTVIMLSVRDAILWNKHLIPNANVQMGQLLGNKVSTQESRCDKN